jgi:hypothetical protein
MRNGFQSFALFTNGSACNRYATECNRVGAHPYFTEPDEFGCKCNPGFSGAITTVFTDSTVNASGSCVQAPQPALSSCWMNSWWDCTRFIQLTCSSSLKRLVSAPGFNPS